MKRVNYFIAFFLFSLVYSVNAQLSLTTGGIAVTIDFEGTVVGVSEGAFSGSGYSSTPSLGQLDSDAWEINGFSNGSLSFGDSQNSGDFARGASVRGVTTGGNYSFNTGAGNNTWGVQPGSSDFTLGDLVLKIENNTGSALDSIKIEYTLYFNNDQGRSTYLNSSYSTDNSNYTDLTILNDTSIQSTDTLGFISKNKSVTVAVSLAIGDDFFVKWKSDDVSGNGSRDEIAIDDISITGIVTNITSTALILTPTLDSVISCYGLMDGEASIVVSGGTMPYTYSWSNGDTTSFADTLGAEKYYVTVTDNVGTTAVDSINVTEPTQLKGSFLVTTVTTQGGSNGAIDLTVSGGVAPYSYLWGNSEVTEDIRNLSAGTYTITITDSKDCELIDSSMIIEPGSLANIIITEIMYNPVESNTDTTEYLEFVNAGTTTINLLGYSIVDGVNSMFTINDSIVAGQYVVIASDSSSFRNRYSFDADFIWTSGRLSNGGESITIVDDFGRTIDSVNFDNISPWPSGSSAGGPAGGGASIELNDTLLDNNLGSNWSASTQLVSGVIINGLQVYGSPRQPLLVGIAKISYLESSLRMYPNPANSQLIIELPIRSDYLEVVQIVGIDGKLVYDGIMTEGRNILNISKLNNGIYFLRIQGEVYKLIIYR